MPCPCWPNRAELEIRLCGHGGERRRQNKVGLAPLFRGFGRPGNHCKVESEGHEDAYRARSCNTACRHGSHLPHAFQRRAPVSLGSVSLEEGHPCRCRLQVQRANPAMREIMRRFCADQGGGAGRSMRERIAGRFPRGTLTGVRTAVCLESSTHRRCYYAIAGHVELSRTAASSVELLAPDRIRARRRPESVSFLKHPHHV